MLLKSLSDSLLLNTGRPYGAQLNPHYRHFYKQVAAMLLKSLSDSLLLAGDFKWMNFCF
jgi:hypothetical protein